jgi:hypothetical protein
MYPACSIVKKHCFRTKFAFDKLLIANIVIALTGEWMSMQHCCNDANRKGNGSSDSFPITNPRWNGLDETGPLQWDRIMNVTACCMELFYQSLKSKKNNSGQFWIVQINLSVSKTSMLQ